MTFSGADGKTETMDVYEFKSGGGVLMGMYNTDEVGSRVGGRSLNMQQIP